MMNSLFPLNCLQKTKVIFHATSPSICAFYLQVFCVVEVLVILGSKKEKHWWAAGPIIQEIKSHETNDLGLDDPIYSATYKRWN